MVVMVTFVVLLIILLFVLFYNIDNTIGILYLLVVMVSIVVMVTAYTNSSYMPDCDEDFSNYDPDGSNGYDNGVYQVIKWEDFQRSKWVALSDANLKDL